MTNVFDKAKAIFAFSDKLVAKLEISLKNHNELSLSARSVRGDFPKLARQK